MQSPITQLHHNAIKHARRAALLWAECTAILEADGLDRYRSIHCALELNERAIDQCRAALNTMDFLIRYASQVEPNKSQH